MSLENPGLRPSRPSVGLHKPVTPPVIVQGYRKRRLFAPAQRTGFQPARRANGQRIPNANPRQELSRNTLRVFVSRASPHAGIAPRRHHPRSDIPR